MAAETPVTCKREFTDSSHVNLSAGKLFELAALLTTVLRALASAVSHQKHPSKNLQSVENTVTACSGQHPERGLQGAAGTLGPPPLRSRVFVEAVKLEPREEDDWEGSVKAEEGSWEAEGTRA